MTKPTTHERATLGNPKVRKDRNPTLPYQNRLHSKCSTRPVEINFTNITLAVAPNNPLSQQQRLISNDIPEATMAVECFPEIQLVMY